MLFEVRVFKIGETIPIKTWKCSYEQVGAYIQRGAALRIESNCPVEVEVFLIPKRFRFYPKQRQPILSNKDECPVDKENPA